MQPPTPEPSPRESGVPITAGQETRTVYARLGGDEPFWNLARAFYARVDKDPDPSFRGMFPSDLTEAIRNQAEFLIQFFGGPTTYSDRKGHPRLRQRHMGFAIDQAARDRWLAHMLASLGDVDIPEVERREMTAYFARASDFLINRG
ncbi:MAG: globin [Phycisphaerae bacterium]|mgnify:CR=1 FL=1|nr:globin [Phycisphaerae bacterium]